MNPILARALHLSCALVAGSGLVFAWMLYLLEPADEFALWNHPAQGLVQRVHVVAAPLLVVTVGAAWLVHVWPRIQSKARARRRTGLVLAWSFAPMALSGYLLQTAVGEGERTAWLAAHLASSAIFTAGYVVHLFSSRIEKEEQAARQERGRKSASSHQPSRCATPPRAREAEIARQSSRRIVRSGS